jgi:hypothetical protein
LEPVLSGAVAFGFVVPAASHRVGDEEFLGGHALLQLVYHQQGPAPGIALVVYRATNGDHRHVLDLFRQAPDLLANAVSAGFITHNLGDDDQPARIQLAPDVAYSLGMVNQLNDDD